jgi:myo-inositol 2-dehydrogenase/D-chiro-inositol 1-dehydrogenase
VVTLFEEAKKNGVALVVGFQRRFDRNFKTLKAKLEKGAIGGVEVVRIISRDPSNNPEPFIDNRAPKQEDFINSVYDSLIHDFDMAQWLVGGEEHSQLFISNPHPESVSIQLKYPSGILLAINWAKSMKYGYDQRVEVFGETGLLAVENEKNSAVIHYHTEGGNVDDLNSFFPSRYEHAYKEELNHFLDVAQGKAQPLITPEHCIRLSHKLLPFFCCDSLS